MSNFGLFIQTATRHYRTCKIIFIKPTLTYFLGTIRKIIVTAIFLGLLSCGTAYLIYLSLARIACGLESILMFTLEVYYKFIVRHDLPFILHTFLKTYYVA